MSNNPTRFTQYMDEQQKHLHEKFSPNHWLSRPENVERFLALNTFYRKNLHRFAEDYLGLKLYLYQKIILYLMGRSAFLVIVASRASAKSFIIAVGLVCIAILYPNSSLVLTSGTRGQSRNVIHKKIEGELVPNSPALAREIASIKDNQNEVSVKFHNGSEIFTVTCSKTARSNRATTVVGEEAREINKTTYDQAISPFQFVRPTEFRKLPPYEGDKQFLEESREIFLSSSVEESHWLYKSACQARDGMLRGNGDYFIAMDLSISLRHGIRTKKQLIRERKKIDSVTFAIEYENAVLRESANAFFPYELVKQNCVLTRAFYPRKNEDVVNHTKNKYDIPKQPGEIRLVSGDIAAIDRKGNDNSCFTCIRLFPDHVMLDDTHSKQVYRIQAPYLEAFRGSTALDQAMRMRQLYEDFNADYIVIDARSFGLAVCDELMKVMYDTERGVEYNAFTCINDQAIAARINNPSAEPRIYSVTASARSNDEMVVLLKQMMIERRLDLLATREEADMVLSQLSPGYRTGDPDEQLFLEAPYLETLYLRKELIDLTYTKSETTGLIRIKEPANGTKDRFSSLEYGCWFADKLAIDLENSENDRIISSADAQICVSAIF